MPNAVNNLGMNPHIIAGDPRPVDNQRTLSEEAQAVIRHANPSKANLVGRIFLGIFSVGLSEGIRAIVHHVRVGHSVDRMAAKLARRDITAEQAQEAIQLVFDKHQRTALKVFAKLVTIDPVKANEVKGALMASPLNSD